MEGTKIKFSDIFNELQGTIDKMSDTTLKKVYCAACITVSSMIINKTDPYTDKLTLSFEEAYNDIQAFKTKNEL